MATRSLGRDGSRRGSAAPVLLEREHEIERLEEAFAATRDGEGQLVIVTGAPGIGKTRLIRAAASLSDERGLTPLRARAGELEREFPFGVMQQLLEPPLRAASDEERGHLLSGPARLAEGLFSIEGPPPSVEDPSMLDHSLYWLAANLSDRGPLAMFVDDVHWCDGPSLRALVHLARRLEELPIAMVIALRPNEPGTRQSFMDRLLAEPLAQPLELAPLSAEASAAVITARLPGAEEAFCRACHAASAGNPFLLTELAAEISASGIAPTAASAARVPSIGPKGVSRRLLLRLSSLPAAAQELAQWLAILGDGARMPDAARLAELELSDASAHLDDLARLELVLPGQPVRFVHALLRAAIIGGLEPSERSARHRAAAQLLAELAARQQRRTSDNAVAAHLLATHPNADRWVVERLRSAAEQAGGSAPDTVVAYLTRALEEPPAAHERSEVMFALGIAEVQAGAPDAEEHLEGALEAAGDPAQTATIARILGVVQCFGGHWDDGVRTVLRAIDAARKDAQELVLPLEMTLTTTLYIDLDGHQDRLERLERMTPRRSGGAAIDRMILGRQAYAAAMTGKPVREVVALAHGALSEGALHLEEQFSAGFDMAVTALAIADELDDADRHLAVGLNDFRARGRARRVAILGGLAASIAYRRGRIAVAEADARQALELLDPEELLYAPTIASLIDALVERDELDAAATILEEHGYDKAIPAGGLKDGLWMARARLRLARGETEDGLADALAFGQICDRLRRTNPAWSPWRSTAALAHAELGRTEAARALIAQELELARAFGAPRAIGIAMRAAALLLKGDERIAGLQEAISALEHSSAELELARALTEIGAAHTAARRAEDAREPLRRALEIADPCGALALAERIRRELRAAGARPRRVAQTGVASLTPSERRVADLAAEGMTNREVAQALFVTTKTVEAHLRNAYGKLGIASKGELPEVMAARA